MTLIKTITVLFAFFAVSRVLLRFKEKTISFGSFLLWTTIWGAVVLVVFNPGIADQTAALFGLQRGTDTMFFFAAVLLFYLLFRLYVKLDILDKDITRLATNTSKQLHGFSNRTRKE
jgi:hypothetical protein